MLIPSRMLHVYLLLGGWDESLCWGPHRLLQTPPQQLHHELLSPHTPAMWTLVGTSSVHAWAQARETGCPRSTLHWHRSEKLDNKYSGNAANRWLEVSPFLMEYLLFQQVLIAKGRCHFVTTNTTLKSMYHTSFPMDSLSMLQPPGRFLSNLILIAGSAPLGVTWNFILFFTVRS